jgi:hypothetical protein
MSTVFPVIKSMMRIDDDPCTYSVMDSAMVNKCHK